MKIHEYQARDLLSAFGIPVPAGVVVTMQGGPAYVYTPKLLEALDALNAQ